MIRVEAYVENLIQFREKKWEGVCMRGSRGTLFLEMLNFERLRGGFAFSPLGCPLRPLKQDPIFADKLFEQPELDFFFWEDGSSYGRTSLGQHETTCVGWLGDKEMGFFARGFTAVTPIYVCRGGEEKAVGMHMVPHLAQVIKEILTQSVWLPSNQKRSYNLWIKINRELFYIADDKQLRAALGIAGGPLSLMRHTIWLVPANVWHRLTHCEEGGVRTLEGDEDCLHLLLTHLLGQALKSDGEVKAASTLNGVVSSLRRQKV
uniref:Uncharacterized protein n=1 Tax=Chromera velia CCMP2878 TaxID=1169474 RepID=A0A0G4HJS9_9ALVE|eukprot:Cvel_28370.t1-p1 / transcript=Cvel_28370.t1 / gene=Cvel_28370 / organism=Chromera_velia_CCMP2878 / gene_product=hypothetical protein / transcript_product=hypothetical protein / location=Cvel_scaffold3699:7871-9231(+) / protein_length=261 / sequence_SO=supercontig / SO=protein_coding / is_pseudo=false